jgi:beta-alanine degradation protein BauB
MSSDLNELRRALLTALPLIALTERSEAQDAAKMQPQSYRVAMENDHVRVLDFNSRPGMGVCGMGMHSHPGHVTVLLSTGNVRVRTPDGKVQEMHDLPMGAVFWEDPVTHTVENISGSAMRALIIEVKPSKV